MQAGKWVLERRTYAVYKHRREPGHECVGIHILTVLDSSYILCPILFCLL